MTLLRLLSLLVLLILGLLGFDHLGSADPLAHRALPPGELALRDDACMAGTPDGVPGRCLRHPRGAWFAAETAPMVCYQGTKARTPKQNTAGAGALPKMPTTRSTG